MRLTSLAHGGGCGCKLSPGVLKEILSAMPLPGLFPNLLVGTETSDDAAVWRLNDSQALVATTDFFMPVVDDPFDFGRIAAVVSRPSQSMDVRCYASSGAIRQFVWGQG